MYTLPTAAGGSPPNLGFYDIVAAEAERTQSRAVLVGYSQGGLVARFLAYMDEYFMRPEARSIAGFITVQAPNLGSPLANPKNQDNVAKGIFGLLAGLGGYVIPPVGTSNHMGDTLDQLVKGTLQLSERPREMDLDVIGALLEAAIKDQPGKQSEFVRTARRWLSGLSPESVNTAFDDLNPENLDVRGTVLERVHTWPATGTLHAAVAGTDNQLMDFLVDMVPPVLRFVAKGVLSDDKIAGQLRTAAATYSKIALNEAPTGFATGPVHRAVAELFTTGASVMTPGGGSTLIPSYAHDFVIPSISEAMYALPGSVRPATFLGNHVNPNGTHISGGDGDDPDSDRSRVVDLLHAIAQRLG